MSGFRTVASASVAAIMLALSLSEPAQADVPGLPAGIATVKKGHGWQFVNDKGMTLYIYDKDEEKPGSSNCNKDCAVTWPPFLAPADAQPHDDWSIVTRLDTAKQWAYKGKPLYSYVTDGFPGSMFGDGVGTIWHVAFQPIATPAEVKLGKTLLGDALTDSKNMTLYTFDSDKSGKSACNGACLKTWIPITAPWLANASEDWTIVTRDEGTKQWAYKGKPLYRYANDVNPVETFGDGVAKGWHAAILEPAAAFPPFVTVQSSDAGQLLANEKGLTIYAQGGGGNGRRFFSAKCSDGKGDCTEPDWIPVVAAKDSKPVGSWSFADLPDGSKQWTYKGNKIFTNVLDQRAGEFKGIRFGGDRSWAAIMRTGQPMQGVTTGG